MIFISSQKFFLFLRYLKFFLDFLAMLRNGLISFKIYDFTTWLTNNYNTHNDQYLKK